MPQNLLRMETDLVGVKNDSSEDHPVATERKNKTMSELDFILVGIAALIGGAVNALAGGGTLITFPMLTAVGIPAVAANVTNTVALCPGYLGGTFAQIKDLRGNPGRLWVMSLTGMLGGIAGSLLLLNTGEQTFRMLVPYLILLASALLAVQEPVRAWILRRAGEAGTGTVHEAMMVFAVALSAVYGGYFGAGLGVMVLAVIGLVLNDTLTRINALKQLVSLATNVAAASFFVFSGKVVWPVALVMAVCALIGGTMGGRLAGRIRPVVLRTIVVIIGVVIAGIYLVR